MPLQEERTGWGVWFFLFLFHTPIYTNGFGDSIPKTMCRKKRHIYIVMFFRMKILICSKPAVIDKFNLLADNGRYIPAAGTALGGCAEDTGPAFQALLTGESAPSAEGGTAFFAASLSAFFFFTDRLGFCFGHLFFCGFVV